MLLLARIKNWLSHQSIFQEFPYWTAALSVGFIAVGYARFYEWAESVSKGLLLSHPTLFLIFAPALFVVSWGLVYFIAPDAKGSGIPQVMASIKKIENHRDEQRVEELLGVKTIVVKVFSSILCLLGGGAIGREGPTVQISAAVFFFVSRKFQRFSQRKFNVEFWLVTGGAAGIAAAFNTPLGGLVYAIEELATSHFNRFKTSLISTVIIAGLASQWVSGPYLYLGFPKLLPINFGVIPWVLLVGLLCGIAGAVFGRLLFSVSTRVGRIQKKALLFFVAASCGFAMALLALYGNHNIIGSGKEAVTSLLFSNDEQGKSWMLAIARFIGPILTYAAGTAGGIFAPALAAGGSIGHWIGQLVQTPHSNLFVLLGMIAFLTGVTRTPFTAFVLVLEMTDRHSAIFPMMLSALVASQIAKRVHPQSFYESLCEMYTAVPEVAVTSSAQAEPSRPKG